MQQDKDTAHYRVELTPKQHLVIKTALDHELRRVTLHQWREELQNAIDALDNNTDEVSS